ncbi:MAG: hypothetical protein WDM79_10590 [Terricaulis sp.]
MEGWGFNEGVAVISALVAVASVVLNWLIVRRQTIIQFETLKAEMDSETMSWAHETIDLVSEGVGLARGRGKIYAGADFRQRAHEISQRLSSAADRGRLIFPNEAPGHHGQEKEAAFQGFRPPILDAVVFTCSQVEKMLPDETEPDEVAAAFMIKCRRLLVSEVQNAIDPRRRGAMLRRFAEGRVDDTKSSFRVAAELGEALEARYPGYLIQRRDAAWIAAREAYARQR